MSKRNWGRRLATTVLLLALAAVAWRYRDRIWQPVAAQPAAASAAPEQPRGAVACLGHFEPENGIVRVAAPYYESRPSVVTQLAVREGEWVHAGQVIALLDGKPQVEAERQHAIAQVELARRRVEQARTGAKPSDVEAQRSEMSRLEANFHHEEQQLKRYETLFSTNDISAADLDVRRNALEVSRKAVEEARHRLAAMNEVREPDVRVAESEAKVAEAQLAQVEARLASLTVYSPVNGRVVAVHTHAGEQTSPEGIVELADTSRMSVEAEVYAADVGAVRAGQAATVELEGATTRLSGTVTRVGAAVQQSTVLPKDPVAYSDAHVVPVQVRVPSCRESGCPIHARVKVVIETAR